MAAIFHYASIVLDPSRRGRTLSVVEFLKSVVGKLVTGAVTLAVFAAGFAWYRMDEAGRSELAGGAGRIVGWIALVAAIPWTIFFLVQRVAKMDSNVASGVFVLGLTLLEAAGLAWMFHFSISGGAGWTFFAVGVVLAGVYNLLMCDWIAERFG
ncbi:hypothetical protein BH10PLA1_BH10PLA1_18110 [soil metagenome]